MFLLSNSIVHGSQDEVIGGREEGGGAGCGGGGAIVGDGLRRKEVHIPSKKRGKRMRRRWRSEE